MDLLPIAPALDLGNGVTCIDTQQGRLQMACCYLLERDGEFALIEAGTAHGVPALLALLDARGVAREAVRYVIPTHVHLDHAGGAGVLMRALPQAKLVAHPRGARHLIDPSKLIAGASAVYGADAVARMYGEIAPVPEARVIVADDGFRLPLGKDELLFIDSPGHARHHFCIWDARSGGLFTGDTFGLSYRELASERGAFVMATTTPVQFEPDAWRTTIDRLLSFAPQQIFFTHYGSSGDVPRMAQDLRDSIARHELLALKLIAHPDRHAALKSAVREELLQSLRRHGCTLPEPEIEGVLATDIDLNAQGLGVWLDTRKMA